MNSPHSVAPVTFRSAKIEDNGATETGGVVRGSAIRKSSFALVYELLRAGEALSRLEQRSGLHSFPAPAALRCRHACLQPCTFASNLTIERVFFPDPGGGRPAQCDLTARHAHRLAWRRGRGPVCPVHRGGRPSSCTTAHVGVDERSAALRALLGTTEPSRSA